MARSWKRGIAIGFTLKMNVFSQELGMIIDQLFLESQAVWKKTKKHGTGGIQMPPEQNSTGVTLPYEKQAMRGDPMPDGLRHPDQLMYQELALLYARYRMNLITREQAQKEKIQFVREYEIHKHKWSMGDRWAEMLKRADCAICEYRKNRVIENADKLVACIDGIGDQNGRN